MPTRAVAETTRRLLIAEKNARMWALEAEKARAERDAALAREEALRRELEHIDMVLRGTPSGQRQELLVQGTLEPLVSRRRRLAVALEAVPAVPIGLKGYF